MKFTTTKKQLNAFIQNNAYSTRTVPILQAALIKVYDGNVIFVNSDLDNEIEVIVATDCIEPLNSNVMFDLGTFKLIVKSFTAKDAVNVQVSKEAVIFEQDGIEQSIKCLEFEEEYPFMNGPQLSNSVQFEFEAQDLLKMMKSVAASMSLQDTRFYLNGMFMHSIHQELFLVATDGHRLAKYETGKHCENFEGAIIQYHSINMILKALAKAAKGATAYISTDERRIRFTVGDFALTGKVVDATYPDYQRIIPKNTEFVELETKNLVRAIEPHRTRFKAISGTRGSNPIKLNINGSIELSSVCNDKRFETLLTTNTDIIRHTGKDMSLSLNIELFADAIIAAGHTKTDSPTIRMAIVNDRDPITLHNIELPQLTQVLMPYRP